MRFEFKPSFERSLKSLNFTAKAQAKETAEKVIDFLVTGEKTPGLGIKHLRKNFWEARSGIHTRVLYRQEKDLVEFVLAGNHDEVKRFLKRIK